jgi:hypothetical protein
MIIRSFGVASVAKTLGLLYCVAGLLVGGIFSIFALAAAALNVQQASNGMGIFGLVFGVAAVFVLPILYGVMGLFFGALAAFLYNVTARFSGGIAVDLAPNPAAPEALATPQQHQAV